MRPDSFRVVFTVLALTCSGGGAAAQVGPASLDRIATAAEFASISIPSSDPDVARLTKFLAPVDASDASLVPLVFQNVARFPFHIDFLRSEFPRFAGLSDNEYRALVDRRATRQYYAGVLSLLTPAGREPVYGFELLTANPEDSPAEILTRDEVRSVFEQLKDRFLLEPLAYAPTRREVIAAAAAWETSDPPVFLGSSDVTYIPYTQAVGYGWVRLYDPGQFAGAAERGLINWRDLLVLDRAPRDIEGVVAGVITAERQGELSHVAIRTARRNTPNAFVKDARSRLAQYESTLVRLEVGPAAFAIRPVVDPREAEDFWAANRPSLSVLPVIDADYRTIDALSGIDVSAEAAPVSRFGGKTTGLARLRRYIDEPYREEGLGIPMFYYQQFMRENTIPSPLDPQRDVSLEQHLRELFELPDWERSAELRFERLAAFREHIRDSGVVDPSLIALLVQRIEEVFGARTFMVRFRSSSNIEDALEFNGAGLYDSTSVCAADQVDGDELGPSLCDPRQESERTIERGLRRVWASLWNFRAYEERAWYQIPQELAAMGILVSRAFLDEQANAVAFTGNPSRPYDPRYLVVAQWGEEASVVSPEPGVLPEKSLLEVADGRVTRILRAQKSSLVDRFVLSDDHLRELGAILWKLDQTFPLELGDHSRDEVLLDTEVKLEADDSLAVKQIRPFLLTLSGPQPPTFILDVPEGVQACGVWREGRAPGKAHQLESRLEFRAGRHELPAALESFSADLIERVEVGPGRLEGAPEDAGLFRVGTRPGTGDGRLIYDFRFEQRFSVDGRSLLVELEKTLEARDGDPIAPEWLLDEATIMQLDLEGVLAGDGGEELIRYGSCTHELVALNRVLIDLSGDDRVELDERYELANLGNSPADFVRARVVLDGVERVVESYEQLVYTAQRHNERVVAWIVLEPPMRSRGDQVRVVEVELEDFKHRPSEPPAYPAAVRFLGEGFSLVRQAEIVRYCRREPGNTCASDFRRGDANSDGTVSLSDAVRIFDRLFRGGGEFACPDAADFDDRDGVEVVDAILILNFLFRGVDLSAPPGPLECGPDPTSDGLASCSDSGCREAE